jgi:pimeloyl-ACP methyl ester carboxylesterase
VERHERASHEKVRRGSQRELCLHYRALAAPLLARRGLKCRPRAFVPSFMAHFHSEAGMRMCIFCLATLCAVAYAGSATGQEIKPVPPPGIEIEAAARAELVSTLERIEGLLEETRKEKRVLFEERLLDVEVFTRAVRLALDLNGFYEPSDVDKAKHLLIEADKRLGAIRRRDFSSWLGVSRTVRGFRSRIDGSVQPYGVFHGSWHPERAEKPLGCDVWLHGRGEKMLELQFIYQQLTQSSEIAPPGRIVIHPFGRYCNAFKFAGETDVFEALEHAQRVYDIDPDRVSIRGFSMGGAGAWHLAVHYPDRWCAANPGAGFADTAVYLGLFEKPDALPADYVQKMWRLYDCPPWAMNLRMVPTIAYSGELDKQKLAADTMAKACRALPSIGFELTHIIGPATEHRIHPDSKREIERRLALLVKEGRERTPKNVRFTTYTLKYSKAFWLEVTGLEQHWEPAEVHGRLDLDTAQHPAIIIRESGATGLAIDLDVDQLPERLRKNPQEPVSISVNGHTFVALLLRSDRSLGCRMVKKAEGGWGLEEEGELSALRKRPGLQGPIDDAFMGPFLFVTPSAPCRHEQVENWVKAEMERAMKEWRTHFRGDVRTKVDSAVTEEDIRNYNLICFGDPASNSVIARALEKLPLTWDEERVAFGRQSYPSATHAPVMIYPNPARPDRYLVINSGFTFRGVDYSSNARQTPKLPDWAVVDLTTPADERAPGKVTAAGFFGERWELRE